MNTIILLMALLHIPHYVDLGHRATEFHRGRTDHFCSEQEQLLMGH